MPKLKPAKDASGKPYYEEDKYGLHITEDFVNATGKDAPTYVKGITDVLDEFKVDPKDAREKVKTVDLQRLSGLVYAQYSGGINQITASEARYKNRETLLKTYEGDVKSGYHPKGTTADDILAHETGHALERLLGDRALAKLGKTDFATMWDYGFKDKATRDLVSQACKNIKKTPFGDGKHVSRLKYDLSRYATKNASETYAEAIADYRRNGKKANPLSIEIVRLTKEWLR